MDPALEESASSGGLLPEQVWDQPDIPERELFHGRPSGSAMPLVWAHSEHIKLLRSLRDNAVFDMPAPTVERYLKQGVTSVVRSWRFSEKVRTLPQGKALRIELQAPALVHWSQDDWQTTRDSRTLANDFGIHVVDLPVTDAAVGTMVRFTFYWTDAGHWEGADFAVEIEPPRPPPPQARKPGPSGARKAPPADDSKTG
ncbi:MAG: glucan 1,4-alpha-glucosidase, partial [Rhizobiales bacterium]|nr:glucan 1,4-alpha-glucosidase [Hyphomicrobiales bacterium]